VDRAPNETTDKFIQIREAIFFLHNDISLEEIFFFNQLCGTEKRTL